MLGFQGDYGLRPSGEVDEDTWSALIEASWSLGERLLYLRSPNIRGDDVADLQGRLNRLGFDCGRVDGIFGPLAKKAVSDFQLNIGMESNGVCSPQVVDALSRIGSQSGEGPGVAMVREVAELEESLEANAQLIVGHFPGCASLAHALERRCHTEHLRSSSVDGDAVTQAKAANDSGAGCYIGFETSAETGLVAHFYEVPTFTSVGGHHLAQRIVGSVAAKIPEIPCRAEGLRHPVLRETRMPAVLCVVGPPEIAALKANALATAIRDAWESWLKDPLSDL